MSVLRLLGLVPLLLIGETAQAASDTEVKQAIADATIRIDCLDLRTSGSGMIIGTIGANTYALTALHVLRNAHKLEVHARAGGVLKTYKDEVASVWSLDDIELVRPDLALIRFKTGADKLAAAPLAERQKDLHNVRVFRSGWVEDYPVVQADTLISRILLNLASPPKGPGGNAFYWQTKGTSKQGESGGGLFTESGRLLGICSGNQEDRGYYSDRDEIYAALKRDSSSAMLLSQNGK